MELAVHPPTGKDVVLRTDKVFIGEDGAGGGTDLDAQRTYDLSSTLASFDPHPQQGYHVKLTVHADGAARTPSTKVFWVQRCETNPT